MQPGQSPNRTSAAAATSKAARAVRRHRQQACQARPLQSAALLRKHLQDMEGSKKFGVPFWLSRGSYNEDDRVFRVKNGDPGPLFFGSTVWSICLAGLMLRLRAKRAGPKGPSPSAQLQGLCQQKHDYDSYCGNPEYPIFGYFVPYGVTERVSSTAFTLRDLEPQ